jgi:Pyruvate/2-oxoacid:ferredoxin oxidoreductase delta subunit
MTIQLIISRSNDGDERKGAVENALLEMCASGGGLQVLIVPNLYHLHSESDVWKSLRDISCEMVFVTWIHPRPVESILESHSLKHRLLLNLGVYGSGEACYTALAEELHLTEASDAGSISEIIEQVSERWYPVLDKSRCTNCGHCLQFCIFDVYEVDGDDGVTAAKPDNCKPGCPACSRICPESAIIFPYYRRDDAISGAPGRFVSPDAAARRALYLRTKRPCPACGRVPTLSVMRNFSADAEVCDECGIPMSPVSKPQLSREAMDDIDLLINDLEDLTRRDRGGEDSGFRIQDSGTDLSLEGK